MGIAGKRCAAIHQIALAQRRPEDGWNRLARKPKVRVELRMAAHADQHIDDRRVRAFHDRDIVRGGIRWLESLRVGAPSGGYVTVREVAAA